MSRPVSIEDEIGNLANLEKLEFFETIRQLYATFAINEKSEES